MPSVGLIIQGPLQSFGKTPSTGEYAIARREGRLVQFACPENINRWFTEFGGQFSHVVLSTWNDEDTSQLHPGIEVVKSSKAHLTHTVRGDGKPETRFWQYFGVEAGLNALVDRGVEFALRVRTDQFFDPSELLIWLENPLFSERRNWILVPYAIKEDPTHLGDFYVLAPTTFLQRILHEYCKAQYPLFESIHKDLFWSFFAFSRDTQIDTVRASKHVLLMRSRADLLKSAWGELFFPGPTALLHNLHWRGETFGEDNKLFKLIPTIRNPQESIEFATAFSSVIPRESKCATFVDFLIPQFEVARGFRSAVIESKLVPRITSMQRHPLVRLRRFLLRLCRLLRPSLP